MLHVICEVKIIHLTAIGQLFEITSSLHSRNMNIVVFSFNTVSCKKKSYRECMFMFVSDPHLNFLLVR
jgi:hypothetical protein